VPLGGGPVTRPESGGGLGQVPDGMINHRIRAGRDRNRNAGKRRLATVIIFATGRAAQGQGSVDQSLKLQAGSV